MNRTKPSHHSITAFAALAVTTALAPLAHAGGSDTWFTPLTESAPVVAPNELEELAAPWVTPTGINQQNLTSMNEIENSILSPGQSVVRAEGAGRSASMFDMIAYDPTGNFLFIPHETPWGAGVSRFDIYNRHNDVLFAGDSMGALCGDWEPETPLDICPFWINDYAAFDPCRFTPNGTLFLGEEWSGEGRIMEVMNPFAPVEEIEVRELQSIANVAHEGINFSEKHPDTIYYIDEWRSGSIYKFVMRQPGDYKWGQTFVLSVDAFRGNPADYFSDDSNVGQPRTGMATWIPITDWWGNPLPGLTDPFRNGPTNDPRSNLNTRGGRVVADEVGGTPYGRPEDMEVGTLLNGREVIYFTATSENTIYSVEMLSWNKAYVGVLAGPDTPTNLGFAPTTGVLNSPDNLAQDACGNIYIIEDAPNSSSTGGDIWFVRDVNNDGKAESIDHFLSIRVNGSEATGMIFNPANPLEFVVAVQHPESTNIENVPDGLGDAVWMFDLSLIDNQMFVDNLLNKANGDEPEPFNYWVDYGNGLPDNYGSGYTGNYGYTTPQIPVAPVAPQPTYATVSYSTGYSFPVGGAVYPAASYGMASYGYNNAMGFQNQNGVWWR